MMTSKTESKLSSFKSTYLQNTITGQQQNDDRANISIDTSLKGNNDDLKKWGGNTAIIDCNSSGTGVSPTGVAEFMMAQERSHRHHNEYFTPSISSVEDDPEDSQIHFLPESILGADLSYQNDHDSNIIDDVVADNRNDVDDINEDDRLFRMVKSAQRIGYHQHDDNAKKNDKSVDSLSRPRATVTATTKPTTGTPTTTKKQQPPITTSTTKTPRVMGLVDVSVDSVLQRHSTISSTLNATTTTTTTTTTLSQQQQHQPPLITETESVIEAERLNILARSHLSRGKDTLALSTYQLALQCANRDLSKMKRTILEIEKRDANREDDDGNFVNDDSFLFLTASLPPPLLLPPLHHNPPSSNNTQRRRTMADVRHLKDRITHQRSLIALTVAHTLNNMGVVQEMLSRYSDALSSCREALRLYRDLCPPSDDVASDPDVDRTLRNIAQMNRAKESHEERERLHDEARRYARQARDAEGEGASESAERLLRRVMECYEEVLRVERRSLGGSHPNVAKTLRGRGCVKWKLYRMMGMMRRGRVVVEGEARAEEEVLADINNDLTTAVRTLEAAFGGRHPEVVIALDRLGSFQEEGLRQFDVALETYKKILMADVYEGAKKGRLLNIVGVLHARRKGESRRVAMEYFEESLAAYSEEDEDKAMVYRNLGYLQYDGDEYAKALQSFQRALQIKRRHLPNDDCCHPDVADRLMDVAMVYTTMKQYGRALNAYERLLAMRRAMGDYDAVASMYDAMGHVHTRRGDDAMALICRKKALEERRRRLPESDPAIASSLVALGSLRAKKCRYDDAMVLFEEAIRIYSASGMMGAEMENIKRLCRKIEQAELMLSSSLKGVDGDGNSDDDCDLATTMDNRGCKLLNRGDYTGSLDAFRNALSLRRKFNNNNNNDDSVVVSDDDDPGIAVSLFHMATVYTKMERFLEASVLLHEALSILRTRGLNDDDERVKRIVMALRELDEEEEDVW